MDCLAGANDLNDSTEIDSSLDHNFASFQQKNVFVSNGQKQIFKPPQCGKNLKNLTLDAVTSKQKQVRKKIKDMLFFATDGTIRCLPCSEDPEKKLGKSSAFLTHHDAHLHVTRHFNDLICDACWCKCQTWQGVNIHKGMNHPNFVFDENYFSN